MKVLIALLLLASPAVAQTPLDISIAIAIAEAEAASKPDVVPDNHKPTVAAPAKDKTPVQSNAARSGYPIRGSWWTGCPNWTHLTRGEHAGLFDHAWLQSLSNAELQSLHSDHHEGRTKWAYVVRPAAKAQPITRSSSGCPGGVCPSPSRGGLFRRR